MEELNRVWSFLVGLLAGWLVVGLALGAPRAVRSVHRWTSAALFSSQSGTRQRIALFAGSAAALWLLVLAGTLYAPVAASAGEVLPIPGAIRNSIIAVNLWILVACLPLVVGFVEAAFERGDARHRIATVPQGFLHVPALAFALALLVPWVVWSRLTQLIRRQHPEQHRGAIDLEVYDVVIDALRVNLENTGLSAAIEPPPPPVVWSRALLDRYGPSMFRPAVAYSPRQIRGTGYRVLVFDGLLDLVADRAARGRVRLALLGSLPPSGLWWTHSEEARSLEARIRAGDGLLDDLPARIAELDTGLDDWRALNREYLQVVTLASRTGDGRPRESP